MNAKNKNKGEGPLRLGRIPRAVERGHKLSLSGDLFVYVDQGTLSALTERKPDTYLRTLEEASSVISHPDFTAFSSSTERIVFCRFYAMGQCFIPFFVYIRHLGKPKRWKLEAIKSGPKAEVDLWPDMNFVRPIWKNKTIEA